MADPHAHPHPTDGRAVRLLALVLGLTATFAVVEILGGLWSNSLALLADAGHMLTDVMALALALFAAWSARRPPDASRTYGYRRAEILAALFNGLLLVAIAVTILREAWDRLVEPREIGLGTMAAVAFLGLAVNAVGARLLHGREHGLNVRAAYLHVLGDLLGSIGVLVAAALIAVFGWVWADPLASAVIAVFVVVNAVRLILDSSHVLMEGAPAHVRADELREALHALPGVCDVHDLHVWSLGGVEPLLTAHLVLDHTRAGTSVLRAATSLLATRFGIEHATLQVEPPDFNIAGPGPADRRPAEPRRGTL